MDSNHRWALCRSAAFAARRRDRVCVKWTHWDLHPDFRLAEPASSCWTMSPIKAEAVRLELTSGSKPLPVFETGSSSGRITPIAEGVGLAPTGLSPYPRSRRAPHLAGSLPRCCRALGGSRTHSLVPTKNVAISRTSAGSAALCMRGQRRTAFEFTLFTFWPPGPLLRTNVNVNSSCRI